MKYFQLFLIGLLPFIVASFHLSVNIQTHRLQADSLRVVVSVNINYDDNMVTPFVNVMINGRLFKAVFDTGSAWFRIMEGVLTAEQNATSSQRVYYTYGNNIHKLSLKGKVRKVQLSFDESVPSCNYITLRLGDLKDTVFIKTGFTVGNERSGGKDFVYLDESPKGPKMIFGIRLFLSLMYFMINKMTL
jgi:hypothetical protein